MIRRRRDAWQVDIFIDGKRHRKQFKTRAEAKNYEIACASQGTIEGAAEKQEQPKESRTAGGELRTLNEWRGVRIRSRHGNALLERMIAYFGKDARPLSFKASQLERFWFEEFPTRTESSQKRINGGRYRNNPVEGYSSHTREAYSGALRVLLRTMGVSEIVVAAIPRVRKHLLRNVTVDDASFEAVMEASDNAMRLMLLLCRDAALRTGTAAKVRACHIACEGEQMYIRRESKIGNWTNTPVTPRLREMLTAAVKLAAPDQTLVCALDNSEHLTDNSIRKRILTAKRKAAAKLGVSMEWELHDLRRTTARRLYDATGDLRKVQRLLTHQQASTTLVYLTGAEAPLTGDEIAMAIEARRDSHVRHDETGTSDGAGEAEVPGAVDTIRGVSRHAGGFSGRGIGY